MALFALLPNVLGGCLRLSLMLAIVSQLKLPTISSSRPSKSFVTETGRRLFYELGKALLFFFGSCINIPFHSHGEDQTHEINSVAFFAFLRIQKGRRT